ncbi:hypothetical protein BCON_0077g00040 [Botryotinia convoluta]|uniref:Aminoglycoside phosphotransferase domain-containing protein n=1 Tax=Botryotinia convoluta TaxID=54673 RepID=A0A4Z1IBX5_9HELO|nr:hypothetical protein BCON_0077g00040 [Botryotinia convoluta]
MSSIKSLLRKVASKFKFKVAKSMQKNPPPSMSDDASTLDVTMVNDSTNIDHGFPPTSQSTPAIVDSDSFDGRDNKTALDDTSKSPSLSPSDRISPNNSEHIKNPVPSDISFLGAPSNNPDEIMEIPEPSEGTLEGLQQCIQSNAGSQSSSSDRSHVSKGTGSTWEYEGQEPFATYTPKVIKLCHDLGLGEPLKVDRMSGGSYNRVISLSFPAKNAINDEEYVLRICRGFVADESARDQAAVLHHVAPLMPVPKVLAFDPTSDNVIEHSYVLQEKLRGKNAGEVYYDLPENEKIEVIDLVADIITKLNAVKTDRPGQFVASPSFPPISNGPITTPIDIDITGYRFEDDGTSTNMPTFEKQSLASHLISVFETRKQYDVDKGWFHTDELWDQLSNMAKQMQTAGLFSKGDTDCVMWHWDIAFRNILIEKNTLGKWKVTGVLDWDKLRSVPLVLTRAPAVWIWCNEDDRSSRWFQGLCDKEITPSRALTLKELLLKGYFEQIMQRADPNYMADTYGRGVWIRRLAHFAVRGISAVEDFDKYENLVRDWNEYYKSFGFDTDTNMEAVDDEDGSDTDEDETDIAKKCSSQTSRNSNRSNQSSASSTYEFNQEPFDTYKLKVTQLCQDIGFGPPSNVEYMVGGSYNRVIGLTFPGKSEDRQFILRIPRSPFEDYELYKIRDQAATLLFLKQFDFLCVPTIAAIDTTTDNAIESQFVLQETITGKPLSEGFSTLLLAEKLELTTLVTQLLIKMEDITIEKPGVLAGAQPLPWVSTSIHQSNSPPVISGFHIDPIHVASPLGKQGLASLLFNMLNDQKKTYGTCENVVLLWNQLLDVLKQMEKAGFFKDSDSTNILWNWDLCARHIFVEKDDSLTPAVPCSTSTLDITQPLNPDHVGDNSTESETNNKAEASQTPDGQTQVTSGGWKITGTIDWDDAISVPCVITRVPRTWLWFDDNERTEFWDGERETPPERALTEDELAIKNHFDQIMQQADPNYMNDTYFRGVWIRRLFKFTQTGFCYSADFERCDKFVKDWKNYFDSHVLMMQEPGSE